MKTKMILLAFILFAGLTLTSFQKDKSVDKSADKTTLHLTEVQLLSAPYEGTFNYQNAVTGMLSATPNPFKQFTTIIFEVENPGQVLLVIRNEVKQYSVVLFQGYKKKGLYRIEFDGRQHSPGRYTIVLMTGNSEISQNLIKLQDDSSGLAHGQ